MFFFSILRDDARVVAYQKQNTKGYVKFLALKVVAVAKNIWEVVAYERVLKRYLIETKRLFILAYENWSLQESWLYYAVWEILKAKNLNNDTTGNICLFEGFLYGDYN